MVPMQLSPIETLTLYVNFLHDLHRKGADRDLLPSFDYVLEDLLFDQLAYCLVGTSLETILIQSSR